MAYDIITRINDKIISRVAFEGYLAAPEVITIKPAKHYDYDYYYFVIDSNPIQVKQTDLMTIEQINIDD